MLCLKQGHQPCHQQLRGKEGPGKMDKWMAHSCTGRSCLYTLRLSTWKFPSHCSLIAFPHIILLHCGVQGQGLHSSFYLTDIVIAPLKDEPKAQDRDLRTGHCFLFSMFFSMNWSSSLSPPVLSLRPPVLVYCSPGN